MATPYHQSGVRLSTDNAYRLRMFIAKHRTPKACELLGVGVVSLDKVTSGGAAAARTIARLVAALDEVAA